MLRPHTIRLSVCFPSALRDVGFMYNLCLSVVMFPAVPTFFLDFLTLEDGADKMSRNVGTILPLNAV
jgi:hypothetical protein